MSKTIAVHLRYNFLCISLPSSAKQQREMTNFCVVYGTWTTTANFSIRIPIWNCTLSLHMFNLSKVLDFRAIGVLTRTKHSRISLVKYKFISY